MKKSLIAVIVAGSFVLAGCSSSSGADAGTESTPQRPAPVDPEFGLETTPDWGLAPSQPPIDDAPDWGVDIPAVQPPIDNSPERPQPELDPDWGVTPDNAPDRLPPTWGGACGSPEDGANCAPIPPKPPTDVDNDWGVNPPEVSPAINNIDRNKVRDAIRSRLNG